MLKKISHKKNIIGIDIGGTKIHLGRYQITNNPLKPLELETEIKLPTEAQQGLESVLEKTKQEILKFKTANTIAVGIGIPGYTDCKKGIVYKTPNIPHKKPIDLKKFFKSIDLPSFFQNDANLFAYAEYNLHWHKKVNDMLGITVGTGLGGGIIIDGKIYNGKSGLSAEFGHIAFNEKHELEDFASGKGKLEHRGKYLGIAISNLINIFNPEVIALAGSAVTEFPIMEEDMWAEIEKRTVEFARKGLKVYISKIKNPGTVGAALFALNSTPQKTK